MERTPPSPDEVIQRDQIRRAITVLIPVAIAYGVAQFVAGLVWGSPRTVALAVLMWAVAVWLTAFPRRALDRKSAASTVAPVALVSGGTLVIAAVLQPFAAYTAAIALLVPVLLGLPYIEGGSLRRLVFLAWVASIATGAAALLPDDVALPATAIEAMRLAALALVLGIVLIFVYQSSERLKSSGREFRHLFRLSTELAETTDPGVLGNLVARHLADATGFDDCVIYALAPQTDRLTPFGSHPVADAVEATPESLATRPMLRRAVEGRERIIIDIADEHADPAERRVLQALGRASMLLLPLAGHSEPVGVAQLTAGRHYAIDERRLAFARTLAFEAAMAIENGRLYQQLRERSLHDPLTGLANSSLFRDRIEHALARLARRDGQSIAVLFLDLDDFKLVNDSFGHAQGDALLALVAERLRTVVRPGDTVARLGGDEFAVLLDEVASVDEALVVADRAIAAIAAPFEISGRPARTSVSIGVAHRSTAEVTVEELIEEADAAMYGAKRGGKARAVLFQPSLRPAAPVPMAAAAAKHPRGDS